jgi:hypothetical protein
VTRPRKEEGGHTVDDGGHHGGNEQKFDEKSSFSLDSQGVE